MDDKMKQGFAFIYALIDSICCTLETRLGPFNLNACGILGVILIKRTNMASRRNIRYSNLDVDDDDYYNSGGREDPRFNYSLNPSNEIPWKSIALALFLLSIGCGLLFFSFFIYTGHMGGEPYQAYGMLGLGILTFLPGFYETRVAYYSWRGAQGYSFRSIPEY